MNRVFSEGKKYENKRFHDTPLEIGEYENCTFKNCDFSDSTLSEINFLDCEFQECNLSLTNLLKTSFGGIIFKNCKLLGLHFEECNDLMIILTFTGCSLDLCSFNKLKIRSTVFENSRVTEADFTETDLKNSSFQNCDLHRTIFKNTNLEGVDFRTAFNYSIDPDTNRIKKAKFSLAGIAGLLDKYDIEIEQ